MCTPSAVGLGRTAAALLRIRDVPVLVAGDKAGSWIKRYRKNIAIAADRFDQHLKKLKGES